MSRYSTNILSYHQGLEFDGVDDYVEIVNDAGALVNDSFTVSVECRISAVPGSYRTFVLMDSSQSWYSWALRVSDINCPQFAVSYNGNNWIAATSDNIISTHDAIHLCGVYDNNTKDILLYVNGSLVAEETLPGVRNISDGNIFLGWYPFENFFVNSIINRVSIYNVVLTEEEISDLYEGVFSENDPDLIAYYPMNEGLGNVIYDQSPLMLDGNIMGAKWTNKIGYKYA